ncbi:hypothetical protein F2P81_025534 [Scophthalmus maximus]|uniref:Uncharacterized protein n=1 Tax=Scophthalmus maximus TaxID=52904 RepID=A0A6A4RPU0_SCOMX|nr:hypothetical protein F2P81_025534 [Scophthalmus maximus]
MCAEVEVIQSWVNFNWLEQRLRQRRYQFTTESVGSPSFFGRNGKPDSNWLRPFWGDQQNYDKILTVQIELDGEEAVTSMELMTCVRELCGGLIACRVTGEKKYELDKKENVAGNKDCRRDKVRKSTI